MLLATLVYVVSKCRFRQIAQILFVGVDLLIAAADTVGAVLHIVHSRVPDVRKTSARRLRGAVTFQRKFRKFREGGIRLRSHCGHNRSEGGSARGTLAEDKGT